MFSGQEHQESFEIVNSLSVFWEAREGFLIGCIVKICDFFSGSLMTCYNWHIENLVVNCKGF